MLTFYWRHSLPFICFCFTSGDCLTLKLISLLKLRMSITPLFFKYQHARSNPFPFEEVKFVVDGFNENVSFGISWFDSNKLHFSVRHVSQQIES